MIERHMPHVKVVGVDRGGVGTQHRKCFFHGNQIIKYFVVHIVVIYNSVVSCVPTFMLSLRLAEF